MSYQYEWKSLCLPLPDIPWDSEMGRMLRLAVEHETHDVNLILGMNAFHDPLTCDICDKREPGYFQSLVGRWGEE